MSRRFTVTPKGDGLDAANIQPAKTFTKHTTYFIALCASVASADAGVCVVFVVVATQAVLMALAGVL